MTIGNTIVPKNSVIMLANWPSHHSPESWPSDPMSFDANRFLEAEKLKADKNAPEDAKRRVTAALSPYNLFPWGGGSHMCSGRYFAKQEVFIAVAYMLTGFDIEVVGWEHHTGSWDHKAGKQSMRPAQSEQSHVGFGVLSPDRDLRVRMKRKQW